MKVTIMLLFPYEKIIIKTKYAPELVHNLLLRKVTSKYKRRYLTENSDPGKEFFGTVDKTNFKIMRIIWYQNSFLPLIIGHIEKDNNGSTVTLEMRHTIFTLIFMILVLLITGHSAIQDIYILSIGKNRGLDTVKALFPFCFAYILFIVPFKIEALIAHRILNRIFI